MKKCLAVQYLFNDEWRTQAWLPADMPGLADKMLEYMDYFNDLGLQCRFERTEADWMK